MKLIEDKTLNDVIAIIANAKHDFKFAEINALIVTLQNLPLGEAKKDEKESKKDSN